MAQSPSLSTLPGPVETLLLDLATQDATGSLAITDPNGDEATVWLRDGRIYSVSVPGRRALLGARLMSSGILAPEALGEALEIQRTELQGWRLGELLVHLGYVERAVVEAFVAEQLRDMLDDLIDWQIASSKFRNGKRTRQDVAQPSEVALLLGEVRDRRRRWSNLIGVIGTPEAIPSLSVGAVSDSIALDPHDWAMLCKIDGQRSVTDLADACGFTLLEAGEFVASLVTAGLVDVDDEQRPHEPLPMPAHLTEAEDDTEPADATDDVTDLTDADADDSDDADDDTDSRDDAQRAKEALTAVIAALSDDHTSDDEDGVVVEMALHRAPAPDADDAADTADEVDEADDDEADVDNDEIDPVDEVLAVIDETADDPTPEPAVGNDLGDSVARVTAALEGLFGRSKSKPAAKAKVEVVTEAEPAADASETADATDTDVVEASLDSATTLDQEAEVAQPIDEPAAPKSPPHDMASEIARQARDAAMRRTQEKAERIAREEADLRAAEKARQEAEEASRLQAQEADRLAAELLEAKAREESERNERIKRAEEVASRVAVEAQAWAEHAQVLNAERALVETQAWSEHAIHLDQERMLVEAEAWQVHASVLEGERQGSERYAWADHVRWLDDERQSVEAQAWQEHVDVLRVERDTSSGPAWDEHTIWLEAERLTAEPHAWHDHAAWLVQKRIDDEGPAWADHAVWLEAERAAVEALAWADHQAVVAAENATAEEAARLEAARLEAERLEAEAAQALEAERAEAARLEAERLAADEAAALEAARAEAARLDEERQAADEARRIAAEAAAESAHLAAEEASRAEAARLEAEQVANAAAAETARLEAERVETERLEAERAEANRIEASRLLAEHAASEPEPAPTNAAPPTPVVEPSVTEEPRFDVASVLTALNRESEDLGLDSPPASAPVEPDRDPAELQPAAAAAGGSYARGSSSPPDSLARSIDSAALMRELSSLSRTQDDSASGNENGPPASAPVVTRPVTNGAADKNKKKRGIFGR